MKFVITPCVDERRFEALRAAAPDAEWANAATEAEALAEISVADALLGKVTPALLARAGRLRWVQAFTASLEHYVFPDLIAHPCLLSNMRGLFSDVIADQVIGYVLCFARNLHTYIRQQAERRYEPAGGEAARVDFASGPGTVNAMDRATIFLPEATLGVVGFGGIGREVARRARAFGMRVLAVDPRPEGPETWPVDRLDDLLAASDFVAIAAPQTPETVGLFDATRLARMKRSAYLINVGRGPIVVLDDLVAALGDGTIAGAALDVYEVEPLPAGHPLWACPNAILTPHTAGYSTAIAGRHLARLVENVARFARGEAPGSLVDKAAWY